MREIEVILIIFVLLYIIENKPINILMNFIGITISIAIILALNEYIRIIEGEYISYMLILVQVSALTILFGFIIMLYASHLISDIPKSSFKVPFSASTPNQLNKHS